MHPKRIKVTTVKEYIAQFPKPIGERMELIRKTILEVVPQAEEVISYAIPAYKAGGWLIYFSGYAHHISISIPPTPGMYDSVEKDLKNYRYSKSAIQFPHDKPIPFGLIKELIQFRLKFNKENLK